MAADSGPRQTFLSDGREENEAESTIARELNQSSSAFFTICFSMRDCANVCTVKTPIR